MDPGVPGVGRGSAIPRIPPRQAPGSVPVPGHSRDPEDAPSREMLGMSSAGCWSCSWMGSGIIPLGSSGKGCSERSRGVGRAGSAPELLCQGWESTGRSWSGIASRNVREFRVHHPGVRWSSVLPSKTAGWRSENAECGSTERGWGQLCPWEDPGNTQQNFENFGNFWVGEPRASQPCGDPGSGMSPLQ